MKASVAFRKAAEQTYRSGELEKNYPHKRRVKRIRETLQHIDQTWEGGIAEYPLIPLVSILSEDGMVMAAVVYAMIGMLDAPDL